MNPFVDSLIRQTIENLRLMEAFVTAPLGLYSDIKMLRESLPFPEAAELPRDELQRRRAEYGSLTTAPGALVLDAIDSTRAAISALSRVNGIAEADSLRDWMPRALRVLARAEQRTAGELRAEIAKAVTGLYVIVDPEASRDRPVLEVAEASLKGGVKVLQLRDKTQDKGNVLPIAAKLRQMCHDHGALFIMNDHADLARACDAHGLHVGQTDLPVAEARKVLTRRQIVGRSNNGVQESLESQAQGADYIAVGAIYRTGTMGKGARTALGPDMIRKVKEQVSAPVVAIGGINADNIADVARAGADCICVVSAVTFADDPESAARHLVELIESAR